MSDSGDSNSNRTIEPRRVEQIPYARRFNASRTRSDEAVVVHAGTLGRRVAQNIKEELSISVSQFATEEEFELLEKYSPGSASRLIDATIDRIEATTENRREGGKTRRTIDIRGQWMAFAAFLILVVTASLWVWWGHAAAPWLLRWLQFPASRPRQRQPNRKRGGGGGRFRHRSCSTATMDAASA